MMKDRYLEITFRRGKPLAAYLHLGDSTGIKSVRTEPMESGLVVDFGPDGRPIGVEITNPQETSLAQINRLLQSLDLSPMDAHELAPLKAA